MLIIAAVSWVVTFLVTLSVLFTNFNNNMLLIEGNTIISELQFILFIVSFNPCAYLYINFIFTDKSQASTPNRITALIPYYSGKVLERFGIKSERLERGLAILQSHIDTVTDYIVMFGEKIENTYVLIKSEVQKSEHILKLNTFATCVVKILSKQTKKFYNYAVATADMHDSLEISGLMRWMFGILVAVSYKIIMFE